MLAVKRVDQYIESLSLHDTMWGSRRRNSTVRIGWQRNLGFWTEGHAGYSQRALRQTDLP